MDGLHLGGPSTYVGVTTGNPTVVLGNFFACSSTLGDDEVLRCPAPETMLLQRVLAERRQHLQLERQPGRLTTFQTHRRSGLIDGEWRTLLRCPGRSGIRRSEFELTQLRWRRPTRPDHELTRV